MRGIFPLSQGRVVQGYLSVHRERCVSYQDLHRSEADRVPPQAAGPQIQEAVEPLIAQERKEDEDSAPEPPGSFKCEVCGEEAKLSSEFQTAKTEHMQAHERQQPEVGVSFTLQRKRNVRTLHRTEPLDRDERVGHAPSLSHDPSTDMYSPTIKGLSVRELERLADSQYTAEAEVECICTEKVRRGQAIKTLPCSHVFHSKCISQALMRSSKCPFDGTDAL